MSDSQIQVSPDLEGVFAAIDRLVQAVKDGTSFNANTKNDCQIEADQLKSELRKSKPNPKRVRQALDWFKNLDGAVHFGAHLIELVGKLDDLVPGLFR